MRPILTKLAETFEMEYWPNRENAIDEAMVKFMGRLGFKYLGSIWLDNTFVSRFQVSTGRPQQGQEQGFGQKVVKELTVDLKDFFSSYLLMKSLLNDGIYATATTRQNRKEFPAELKKAKL